MVKLKKIMKKIHPMYIMFIVVEEEGISDQGLEAAAGSSAVDGAAALDKKATAGVNRGGAGESEDPKKSCWLCHSHEHAVELRVCRGCNKVRLFSAFLSSQHKCAFCRVDLILLSTRMEYFQACYCSEKCQEETK